MRIRGRSIWLFVRQLLPSATLTNCAVRLQFWSVERSYLQRPTPFTALGGLTFITNQGCTESFKNRMCRVECYHSVIPSRIRRMRYPAYELPRLVGQSLQGTAN